MQRFDFTRDEYNKIVDKCMLNDELSQILEYKIKGYSITKISMEMNMSERTVNRRVKQIKNKIMKSI